jgi:hypothetical protein
MTQHIRHGNEYSIHAWCGLRTDIRPWIIEEDYRDRERKDVTGNVCKNCIAALSKGVRREATGR